MRGEKDDDICPSCWEIAPSGGSFLIYVHAIQHSINNQIKDFHKQAIKSKTLKIRDINKILMAIDSCVCWTLKGEGVLTFNILLNTKDKPM